MAGLSAKTANHLNVVQQLVEEDNDATLAELCERIEQRTGVRVSQSTLFRVLQQLKLTRKKNIPCHPSRK
jgi:transposase